MGELHNEVVHWVSMSCLLDRHACDSPFLSGGSSLT